MPKIANARRTTAENLLDAAEQLFAERGVDAVSVRQIATAAGSSNNFAVQYHFDDKVGLVRALFERRLPALDARRGELLAQVARNERLQDVHALLEALLLPMWEQRDGNGRHSYAAFLAAHWRLTPQSDLRLRHKDLAPTTELIFSLIRAAMPQVCDPLYGTNSRLAFSFFLNSIVEYDHVESHGESSATDEQFIRKILKLTTLLLLAPGE